MGPKNLEEILKQVFGFDEFRGLQRPVIERAMSGQHSLLIMPTGMGKSLCYQVPSVALEGLTIVISPLIALMKDQVDAAVEKGLSATFINSSLNASEREARLQKVSKGQVSLLYVTPERFRKQEFWQALSGQELSLLAIDEAHCISQWGHDFRPDYTRIAEIRQRLGNPTTMALTATATPEVQEDIVEQLGLAPEECEVFSYGVERPNLQLQVEEVHGLDQKLQLFVALRHQHPGPCIVYFSLISSLEEFARGLEKLGLRYLKYHGQMDQRRRSQQQKIFLKSNDEVMLATPAFGLGVDKPDVRLLVHAELPGSIEAYYQEVGRAGRDGNPSHCYLLYDADDISIQMDFIKWANPDPGFVHAVYELISRNPDRVQQEGLDFLRSQMNFYNRRDFRVETAVNLLQRWGCLEVAQDSQRRIKALAPPDRDLLDEKLSGQRLKKQNENLLQMVNYVKTEGDLKLFIYGYFGVDDGTDKIN